MAMLRPMSEMKDSGCKWIGLIPNDWNTIRFKYVHEGANVGMSIDREYWSDEENDIPFYTAQIRPIHMRYTEFPEWKFTSGRDLLLARNATPYVYLPIKHAAYTDHIIRVCIKELFDRRYIRYCLQNSISYDVAEGVSLPTWSISIWNRQTLPLPSFSEQKAIASYLDDRCAKLDEIITEAEKSIEEYKELMQAVIFEAVTKGLDKNVPMKDSGVEWLGEVPSAWKIVRLKYLLTHLIDCPHETPNYTPDGDYYVIRTADQDLGFLRPDENMYRLNEKEYINRIRRLALEKDDIVYGREGERWGIACIIPENKKYCLGQRMLHFRCNMEKIIPRFLMWALNSSGVRMQGVLDTMGSTSPHVNISTVRNFSIPIPDIQSQSAIVEYLDNRVGDMDALISEKQSLIEDLKAYKKSLIYEVVTGKRRVV